MAQPKKLKKGKKKPFLSKKTKRNLKKGAKIAALAGGTLLAGHTVARAARGAGQLASAGKAINNMVSSLPRNAPTFNKI